jgi:hypothetical protein
MSRLRIVVPALAMLGVGMLLGLLLPKRGAAAQETVAPRFANVEAVTWPSGVTGFFDRDSGKLYMYDANLKECVAIRQFKTLGEPSEELR